jgi:hypothetical protein
VIHVLFKNFYDEKYDKVLRTLVSLILELITPVVPVVCLNFRFGSYTLEITDLVTVVC